MQLHRSQTAFVLVSDYFCTCQWRSLTSFVGRRVYKAMVYRQKLNERAAHLSTVV